MKYLFMPCFAEEWLEPRLEAGSRRKGLRALCTSLVQYGASADFLHSLP